MELADGAEEGTVCRRIFVYCHENAEERGRPVAVVAVKKLLLTPMGKIDNRTLEYSFRDFDYLTWCRDNQR